MDRFDIELTGHELERRALMNECLPPGWTEVEIQADEVKAWKMLYSGLDEGQQAIYDMLVEKGVLP